MTFPDLRPILLVVAAIAAAGCSTPAPPRPAMQPLAVAGSFGFSERDVDSDTIEVTYRGAEIRISSQNPRGDSRILAEKEKVHDLALLRAARIARERGMPVFRIVTEKTDSDVDVRSHPRCRPAPFWGYPAYGYGFGYRPYYGWPSDYYCSENRTATSRAISVLTVDLIAVSEGTAPLMSTAETITRLEKIYAGTTYP
ncbi:MAG: hypothetical protein IPK59_02970 [Rhodospirillaceae bacterium]|nr:hypothetical protein [Rhodospirillaceae bacterium]